MDGPISKEQLQAVLNEDMDKMLEEVVGAMNRARPGSIIDDSEERVRQAAGEFRRRRRGKQSAHPVSTLQERGQRLIEGKKILWGAFNRHIFRFQVALYLSAPAFEALLATGIIDENPTHSLRCGGEKMGLASPVRTVRANETQIGFMHQCGGLECLTGPLP